jgi:glycosyltransferase involved in cell wall biosynthesis
MYEQSSHEANVTPKVSIVMAVLNGERYIAEAIQSICDQTYDNFELLVVDDGSTDRTKEIAMSFSSTIDVKYIRHETCRGIAPSMNDGIRNASGDMIAFLDHDDTWFPHFLETQVRYMTAHPDVGMAHSDLQTIDHDGNVLEPSVAVCRNRVEPSGHIFRQVFLHSMICGNTVLIRKECFTRLGLFDENLKWGDYHMWLRIARHYKIDYVNQVLTSYRQHASQSTRSVAVKRPDQESVAMKAIDKLLEQYPEVYEELGRELIKRRRASLFFDLAYSWYSKREFRNARVCVRRAIRLWPTNLAFWTLYLTTMVRPGYADALRSIWRTLRHTNTTETAAAKRAQRIGSAT